MSNVDQLSKTDHLFTEIQNLLGANVQDAALMNHQVTIEVTAADLLHVSHRLRTENTLQFDMLIDVCAVDYLDYGCYEWATESASTTGFSRGREALTPLSEAGSGSDERERHIAWNKPRYAVVYHLLSTVLNHRLRVKVFLDDANLQIPSVMSIWSAADWFEREAFDLFGIWFDGHPDLRRILTDYGFVGYPFRKDFPLSGHVEMRYDAAQGRCVYEPVSIEPRVLVPKVFRDDNRYPQLNDVLNEKSEGAQS